MNLSDRIIADLEKLALEYGVAKIILFASCARRYKSEVDVTSECGEYNGAPVRCSQYR